MTEQKLSGKMKKMTRIYQWIILFAITVGLAVSLLLAGIAMRSVGRQISKNTVFPGPFQINTDVGYSGLKIQAMSGSFAADFKETNHYYFAFDSNMNPCVIHIHGELPEEMERLQNYFYRIDESGLPPSVQMAGMSTLFDEELREFAMEGFNEMVNEEIITEDNFNSYLGEYYLDTTKRPLSLLERQSALPFTAALLLAVTAVGIFCLNIKKARNGCCTLNKYPEDKLLFIDRQLSNAGTLSFGKEGLYLTEDYIVASAEGLEILPYSGISRVYDTTAVTGKRRIVVETTDHRNCALAVSYVKGAAKKSRFDEMLNLVKQKISAKKEEQAAGLYGPGTDATEMEHVLVGMPKGFEYAGAGTIAPIPAWMEPSPSSNLALGFIGAMAGSLAGAIVWVLIGQIGFIAGIAGYAILILAVKGYTKLGGGLDKRGAVCCLIVAVLTVFGANILNSAVTLAIGFLSYDASFETVVFIVTHLFELMEKYEMWGGFFVNLVIGYLLSLWSSYREIGVILNIRQDFSKSNLFE